MRKVFGKSSVTFAMLVLATVGITSGCVATRKYVRNRVDTSANEISGRMDEKDRNLQSGIEGNSSQITELSGVTREHTQKIGSLDSGLKATDEKAAQAMNVGQGAQTTANQAASQVSSLDQKFQNRNHYTVLQEESIPFKFGSWEMEQTHLPALDQVAQQIKSNPDAVLILEGRTDSAGDDAYNIQLGEKRLEAVIRYLVVEQGVPMHQVHQMSFGEAHPAASNDTREGRAQNRAVVLRLMGPSFGGDSGERIISEAATP